MQFDMPPRRPRGESIIPMINVVFLLLIFFLLTAQIAPSTPFPVTPPDSRAEMPAEGRDVLMVAADGRLAWNEARDDAVWSAIAARTGTGPVEIRADAQAPAVLLAGHLRRLRALSPAGARLVVTGG